MFFKELNTVRRNVSGTKDRDVPLDVLHRSCSVHIGMETVAKCRELSVVCIDCSAVMFG